MDRTRIEPSIVNLYGPGAIGEQMLAAGWPMVNHLASSKLDPFVAGRLERAPQPHRALADLNLPHARLTRGQHHEVGAPQAHLAHLAGGQQAVAQPAGGALLPVVAPYTPGERHS